MGIVAAERWRACRGFLQASYGLAEAVGRWWSKAAVLGFGRGRCSHGFDGGGGEDNQLLFVFGSELGLSRKASARVMPHFIGSIL